MSGSIKLSGNLQNCCFGGLQSKSNALSAEHSFSPKPSMSKIKMENNASTSSSVKRNEGWTGQINRKKIYKFWLSHVSASLEGKCWHMSSRGHPTMVTGVKVFLSEVQPPARIFYPEHHHAAAAHQPGTPFVCDIQSSFPSPCFPCAATACFCCPVLSLDGQWWRCCPCSDPKIACSALFLDLVLSLFYEAQSTRH